MAVGAATVWLVETAWDGVDLIRAVLSGYKIGIGIGIGSHLFSGDDIIKGVRKVENVADAGKKLNSIEDSTRVLNAIKKYDDVDEVVKLVNKYDDVDKVIKGLEDFDNIDDLARYLESVDDVITDGSHLLTDMNRLGNTKVTGLNPNSKYATGEFSDHIYITDDIGRIKNVEVESLKLSEADRLKHNPKTPGKLPGDHAGHLIADRFGGSPELDNLVSQLDEVNLSSYKKMENYWANSLENGRAVTDIKINVNYDGDGLRPISFDVSYKIDGEMNLDNFSNIR